MNMNSSFDVLIPDIDSKNLYKEISKELNVPYLSNAAQASINKRMIWVQTSPINSAFSNINVLGTDYLHDVTNNNSDTCFMKIIWIGLLVCFIIGAIVWAKKLRSFYLYKKSLKEMKKNPPFVPKTEKINDNDEDFQYCIAEIKRKIRIMGLKRITNKTVRCLYIEAILFSATCIVNRIVKKRIFLEPQIEDFGEEATGQADYAIIIEETIYSSNKELICIINEKVDQAVLGIMQNLVHESSNYLYGIVTTVTEWYFILYTPESIYCTKNDYQITLTEDILEDDVVLRREVKNVMEVIVGLLKDRVEVDGSPDSKSARTKKYIRE
ncbi:hypothetical protein C1645_826239 [Glomus cerebriforme]|uniref:Uncharacterized protein n=1 Tax=Glomus cerebriforme TaxID=658196 RepID=A0A397SQQ9_9GLOM|nr:hypothetical protein C1645_826239 [Glomus cerebriforme]